jgi:hypothetical protein
VDQLVKVSVLVLVLAYVLPLAMIIMIVPLIVVIQLLDIAVLILLLYAMTTTFALKIYAIPLVDVISPFQLFVYLQAYVSQIPVFLPLVASTLQLTAI